MMDGTRPQDDRKTALVRFYDPAFINEYGRLETLRSVKFNVGFSVALIELYSPDGNSVGNLKAELTADALKRLVAAVLGSVRNCDIAGTNDGAHVIVVLPQTDYFNALSCVKALTEATDYLKKDKAGIRASVTLATFPKDGKTFADVVATALKRAQAKTNSLWAEFEGKNKLFWEIIGDLFSRPYEGFENACFDAGMGYDLTEFFIDQINELVIKEIKRAPRRKGLLYISSKAISPALPAVKTLSSAGQISTTIYLAGDSEPGTNLSEIKNATPLVIDDPRLKETFFTFFLNEHSGYALVCKENWGATFSCFHSCDQYLVEGLINSFRNEYGLGGQ